VLTTGNQLLPFCIIDLAWVTGYLRDISPLKRIPLARKILLADDSVTAQNMGRKILADAGYEVITVNNGSAALKKIAETKPDLIVLDVYMPGYSGLEVCQRLKEVPETSRIPVLLTVGKLEPFKPEEAKRVRAEGFIVKPFEASELLSAMAKLEDKIVPRAEASKPGRFARANAALDEGRYDKTVAGEEDSGWKDRISFPSKKKKAEAENEPNEAATSNPPNVPSKDLHRNDLHDKDLPPFVEPYQPVEAPETRVNHGALAPEGLPKDVTPEEIAALAAAAAQVKGKFADIVAEAAPSRSQLVQQEARPEAHEAVKSEVEQHETVRQEAVQHEAAKTEDQPVAELPRELAKEAHREEPITFAGHKGEEKIETPAAPPSQATEVSLPAPSSSEVVAAISAFEPASAAPPLANSGNGSSSHAPDEHRAEEPVTMAAAAAAGAGFSTGPSRWMAVPVALAAEETALSLEHEMQKAYAAFAAAETSVTEFVASVPAIHHAAPEPAAAALISSPLEAVAAEPVASVPETPATGVAQAMSAVASAATDIVRAAVKEFEAVATSFTSVQPQVSSEPQPAPIASSEPLAEPISEVPQVIEAKSEEKPEASPSETTSRYDAPEPVGELKQEESQSEEAKLQEVKAEEVKTEEPKLEEAKREESKYEESKPQEPNFAASIASSEQASGDQVSASPIPAAELSAHEVSAGHAEPAPPAISRSTEPGKKDSDIAATTAAAWASWRRVRESGDPKSAAESTPQDAARAVAAGAETAPDQNPAVNQDSGDIADIVDSVLADLRPKIVEEISRKMGKKK
jgi:CheY-like chemotaxis protein